MPFDATPYEIRNQALEKMDKVIWLLGDKRRWCKGALRTPDGRHCILGALDVADASDLRDPLLCAIREVTGRARSIESFNDHPLTTHADVLKVLLRAREGLAWPVAGFSQNTSLWLRLGRALRRL